MSESERKAAEFLNQLAVRLEQLAGKLRKSAVTIEDSGTFCETPSEAFSYALREVEKFDANLTTVNTMRLCADLLKEEQ